MGSEMCIRDRLVLVGIIGLLLALSVGLVAIGGRILLDVIVS